MAIAVGCGFIGASLAGSIPAYGDDVAMIGNLARHSCRRRVDGLFAIIESQAPERAETGTEAAE